MTDYDFDAEREVGNEKIDSNENDSSGNWVNKVGGYGMVLQSVDFEKPKPKEKERKTEDGGTEKYEGQTSAAVKLKFVVTRTTEDRSPIGAQYTHSIWVSGSDGQPLSEGGANLLDKAAYRIGIFKIVGTGDERKYAHHETGKATFRVTEFEKFCGQEFAMDIQEDGKFKQCRFHQFWPIEHASALKMLDGATETGIAGESAADSVDNLPAAQPAGTSSGGDDDDFV
jgi:hypothetical protein